MTKPSLLIMFSNLLLIAFLLLPPISLASRSSLAIGSSLSVGVESDLLVSPDNSYTCGFYEVAPNAYTFSIWFSNSANKTQAWTANRDQPVYGHGSRVTMQKHEGLALKDADGKVVWRTDTSSTQANQVQLLNTGNLVAKDIAGKVFWQSFDSPTDTLLLNQTFTRTTKLVSAAAKGSIVSGYYSLIFDNDNVLKLIYSGPDFSGIYWPNSFLPVWMYNRNSYNSSRIAILLNMGEIESSDNFTFKASDVGNGISRRLTLDHDGNIRLYSLNEWTGLWSVTWEAIQDLCQIFGLCGQNGICSYTQSKPICSCPPNHYMIDPSDWSKGCKPTYNISCDNTSELGFLEFPRTGYWGFDHNNIIPVSVKTCMKLCLDQCSCQAILYQIHNGNCYTKGPLFNGQTAPSTKSTVYLKVPKHLATSAVSLGVANDLNCIVSEPQVELVVDTTNISHGKTKWATFYYSLAAFGLIELLFVLSGWWFVFRKDENPSSLEGYKLLSSHFRKFTYKELKRATRNFKDELGRGGSGTVFKGTLDDKRVVAVKKLENVIRGEEEFQAELSLIGRIYHINLVRILGFCSEGSHRLLVLEYIENGSLEKHLFNAQTATTSVLGWEERFKIAVGVARGLAYLHHRCLEWVIHCDVKPDNILIASDFEPKISDFGLSKLSSREGISSNFASPARGTRGYMAPEWTMNVPITSKIDVYSYGVVLLELVSGTQLTDWAMDEDMSGNSNAITRVRELKERIGTRKELAIENIVDPRLNGQFDYKRAEIMVEISFSCLEMVASQRPTMDQVVEKLLS